MTKTIPAQALKYNHTTHATFYYVGTFEANQFTAAQVQRLVGRDWAVENKLHHIKDRTMQEDQCQARASVGTNMALLRSMVSQMKARAQKLLINFVVRTLSINASKRGAQCPPIRPL